MLIVQRNKWFALWLYMKSQPMLWPLAVRCLRIRCGTVWCGVVWCGVLHQPSVIINALKQHGNFIYIQICRFNAFLIIYLNFYIKSCVALQIILIIIIYTWPVYFLVRVKHEYDSKHVGHKERLTHCNLIYLNVHWYVLHKACNLCLQFCIYTQITGSVSRALFKESCVKQLNASRTVNHESARVRKTTILICNK